GDEPGDGPGGAQDADVALPHHPARGQLAGDGLETLGGDADDGTLRHGRSSEVPREPCAPVRNRLQQGCGRRQVRRGGLVVAGGFLHFRQEVAAHKQGNRACRSPPTTSTSTTSRSARNGSRWAEPSPRPTSSTSPA